MDIVYFLISTKLILQGIVTFRLKCGAEPRATEVISNFFLSILIYRRLQWKNFEVLVTERKSIDVRDVLHEVQETLGGLLIIWGC